jgi:hypothetical protein
MAEGSSISKHQTKKISHDTCRLYDEDISIIIEQGKALNGTKDS